MSMEQTTSLVFGVDINQMYARRVRELIDAGVLTGVSLYDGGESPLNRAILVSYSKVLAEGRHWTAGLVDVADATSESDSGHAAAARVIEAAEHVLQRERPIIYTGSARWWIVGEVR